PHPDPEPGPPAARPTRIRNLLQRPPHTPRPTRRSTMSPTPPTDHRTRPAHHPTTRSTRRHPPRVPPCRLTSTDDIFGTYRVDLAGKPHCGAGSGVTSSDWGLWSADPAPHLLPKITDSPPMKITDRPPEQAKYAVGDTGIEPVTSSV